MEKVNQEIRKKLSQVIQEEVDDPIINLLSITRVETTPDLRESKVYFSILNEQELKNAQKILNKMASFLRICLGKKMRIKILPHLKFIADDSIKYSVDIYQKIEEIKKKRKNNNYVKKNNRKNKK
jgi:ribosome-binding factor A